jgi:hypothetical protein
VFEMIGMLLCSTNTMLQKESKKLKTILAANRTRVSRVAGECSTTRPPGLLPLISVHRRDELLHIMAANLVINAWTPAAHPRHADSAAAIRRLAKTCATARLHRARGNSQIKAVMA